MSRLLRVFIPEEIPSGNKGEMAILKGISEAFRQASL